MRNSVFNIFFCRFFCRFSTLKNDFIPTLRLRMLESAVIFAAYDVCYREDMGERPT